MKNFMNKKVDKNTNNYFLYYKFSNHYISSYTMAEMIEIKLQIDSELKARAEAIFRHSDLTAASAIRIFLEKCVSTGKIAYEKDEQDDDDWDIPSPMWSR